MIERIVNMILAICAFNTLTIIVFSALLYRYKNKVSGEVQTAITEVAEDIGENFKQVFSDPNVKRAFSILGSQSGVVRAEKATIEQFNENAANLFPALGIVGERLGMEPSKLMQLWNDPMIGPTLKSVAGDFLSSQGGKSLNTAYPNMGSKGVGNAS